MYYIGSVYLYTKKRGILQCGETAVIENGNLLFGTGDHLNKLQLRVYSLKDLAMP